MSGFRRVGEREVYAGHIISLAVGTIEDPDGDTFERDIVHHPGAVAVVPLLDDERVVLVRQYRAPIDALLLELPAGIRDVDGEPPAETAQRELIEETGHRATTIVPLVSFQNSAGFCDEKVDVFLATGLDVVEQSLQGVEEQHMTVETFTLDELTAMIGRGELTDAKTVIGVLLTLRHLGR